MKKFYKPLAIVAAFALSIFFASCEMAHAEKIAGRTVLRIVNWNTETFFDAVAEGNEYSEFISANSRWNEAKYKTRVARLCDTMQTLDADVYVFEEIENESVLLDIGNQFASRSWDKKNWKYACFAKIPGDAIGCAIVSRFPLCNLTSHALDIRTADEQPSMRPILQVSVLVGKKELRIFVNHWKSKLGGKEKTEVWRNWQESNLSRLLSRSAPSPSLSCGDFNRTISDFSESADAYSIVLRSSLFGENESLAVTSPWFWEESENYYSYFYQGEGERIDHFFFSGDIQAESFRVENDGAWAKDGMPYRYTLYSGEGFSDHFPISTIVSF